MHPDDQQLIRAIEEGFFLFRDMPNEIAHLDIDGVTCRKTVLSHPFLNCVGLTDIEGRADERVATVVAAYAATGSAFGWLITPLTRPADLAEILPKHGVHPAVDAVGMALTDLDREIQVPEGVRVREVGPDNEAAAIEIMARAFPMPHDVATLYHRAFFAVPELRTRAYLATPAGEDAPVSIGYMAFVPGTEIVLLAGSATLEGSRRRGCYAGLLEARLRDAAKDGAKAAVIQAVRDTSAPICRKQGFRDLCDVQMFIWAPQHD